MDITNESKCHSQNAEAECCRWYEPARSDPLTGHSTWDLEDDVGDVEDGENLVVLVSLQTEILFKSSEPSIP